VTSDVSNNYGWNEFSKLKWTATSGTPTCGSTGECITYDAFGRMVENSSGGSYNQLWFTQLGTIVQMAGTTVDYGYFPAPEGGTAIINGNSASYGYMHKDWLGSARIVSSITGHGVTVDQAFSPYGEIYGQFGSTNSPYDMFAGITQNFDPLVMWDTPNRELSVVGRWLSPDPAGTGWNQYAYPTNPNSFIDPSGLACYPFELRLVGRKSGDCPGNNVSFGENWNEFALLENPIPMYGWVYGWHLPPVPTGGAGGIVTVPNGYITYGIADTGWYWGVTGYLSDWLTAGTCFACGSIGEHSWEREPAKVGSPSPSQMTLQQAVQAECLQEAYNANNGSGAPTPAVSGPSSDVANANGAIYQEWNKGTNRSPFLANPEGLADGQIAEMALIPPQLFVYAAYKSCVHNLTGK
jgi:hypothetical protein